MVVAVTAPADTVPVAGRDREGTGVLPTVSPAQTHPGMAHTLAVGEHVTGQPTCMAHISAPSCFGLVSRDLQIDTSEECFLRFHNDVKKYRWKITRAWIGPIYGGIGIQHPEPLRKILKSGSCVAILITLKNNTSLVFKGSLVLYGSS